MLNAQQHLAFLCYSWNQSCRVPWFRCVNHPILHQNYEPFKNNRKHFFFQTFFETFFFFFISIYCKQWFFQNISLNLFPDTAFAPCKTLYFKKVFKNELKGNFQPLCHACLGPYQAQFLPRIFFFVLYGYSLWSFVLQIYFESMMHVCLNRYNVVLW